MIFPMLVYGGIALGAIGVAIALPRKGMNPQLVGALIAALALGLAFIGLVLPHLSQIGAANEAGESWFANLPSPYTYIFSLIALGSALRVITHPRPVYSALYFILTVLASASMYLMIGAEFMAFALVIIYAGAILITYLFVIMLATQAPSEEAIDALSPYDAQAREPIVATVLGFTLLAVLTGTLAQGLSDPETRPIVAHAIDEDVQLAQMPKKVISTYDRLGVFPALEEPGLAQINGTADVAPIVDFAVRTITLTVDDAERWAMISEFPRVKDLIVSSEGSSVVLALPEGLVLENTEAVGWSLIADHPMAMEIAGVVLLMAMLGAVVLARKQIEIDQSEKEEAQAALNDSTGSSVARGHHVMVTGDDTPAGPANDGGKA